MANLPTIAGPDAVDVARYVVAGDSSGATLSTLCGHVLRPRPKAVIDVFGMVDVLDQRELPDLTSRTAMCDPWWLEYDNPEVAMDKAKRDRNPANAEIACPWSWELPGEMSLEDLRSFWCLPDFTVQDKHYRRLDLSNYLGWKAEGFDGIYRKDTFKDDVEYTAYLKSVSPYYLLDEYPDYPPTFIIHGTADLAVRVEQSYKFAEKLRDLDVPVGERYKWGGEHCFENQIEVRQVELCGTRCRG
jgi:acetyl esterase/lipase